MKNTARRRKNQNRKKGSKHGHARNGSKDSRGGVTRLQQRNMRNRAVELEISQTPPAAKQYTSSQIVSEFSPAASKSTQPLVPEPRADPLPNIRSPSPSTYYQQRNELKPQRFSNDSLDELKPQRFSNDSLDHVKAVLEGIGFVNPVVANPYGKAIEEVSEDPFGKSLTVADPYRVKGFLSPVHPEQSVVAESPEADVSWEEANRGRLSVFKNIGNKSRSCRW